MLLVSIILLTLIYSVAIQGFIEIFSQPLGLEYETSIISLLLAVIGIMLGLIFYALSFLKKVVKNYIILGFPGFIFFTFLIVYFIGGVDLFIEILSLFVKIGLFLMLCTIPIAGCYGLLKKQRNIIIASGVGLMFFFFFTKFLIGEFVISVDQIEILILFFISFIAFLELGLASINYNSVVDKMTPNEDSDENLLLHFNNVLNNYIVLISIVLFSCFGFTLIIFQYNYQFMSIIPQELLDIDLTSAYGMCFLVIITIISAFMFWYLIPREKTKNVQKK